VRWDWIVDETRALRPFATAASVAEYVADAVNHASLDRWDGQPAPLILCESRSWQARSTASSGDFPSTVRLRRFQRPAGSVTSATQRSSTVARTSLCELDRG